MRTPNRVGYTQALLSLCLLLVFQRSGDAQTMRSSGPYLCNYAKIVVTGSAFSVIVYNKPRAHAASLARLNAGQEVYTCDDYGGWVKISFGDASTPCGITHKNGLREDLAKACRTGWIKQRLVNIISG